MFRRADKPIRKGDSVMGEKELKTILKKHRAWLAGREGGERADFAGTGLREADLKGTILKEADFKGVDLRMANLREADLRKADLRWADLIKASLREVKLERANLRGAYLRDANLEGANLRDTNLEGADLRGANLRETDLRGADIDFSCLPLCCGSLTAHFDDRQLKQIAYHLVKAGLHSRNASEETKAELSKLIDFANGFHRVDECGRIEQV